MELACTLGSSTTTYQRILNSNGPVPELVRPESEFRSTAQGTTARIGASPFPAP